jgi:hypothetical protein
MRNHACEPQSTSSIAPSVEMLPVDVEGAESADCAWAIGGAVVCTFAFDLRFLSFDAIFFRCDFANDARASIASQM